MAHRGTGVGTRSCPNEGGVRADLLEHFRLIHPRKIANKNVLFNH